MAQVKVRTADDYSEIQASWYLRAVQWMIVLLEKVRENLVEKIPGLTDPEQDIDSPESDIEEPHPLLLLKKRADQVEKSADRVVRMLQMRMNIRAHKQKVRSHASSLPVSERVVQDVSSLTRQTMEVLEQAEKLGVIALSPQEKAAMEQLFQGVAAQAERAGDFAK